MKKLYILSLALLTSALSFGQAFTGTYGFDNVTATSGLTDPTPVPTATGVTFGQFKAVNPVSTNSTAGLRFSFDNQPLGATNGDNTYANLTGTLATNTYFEVTITPQSGYSINLSQITFRTQRSGTGIRTYAVRSSVDGYATNLPASINPANSELSVQSGNVFFRVLDATITGQNGSTITLGAGYSSLTTPVTFRFYGWNAEASGGTFSIDDVAITGSAATLGLQDNAIAGLKVYPNPVSGNNFYISSDASAVKSVLVYDVLGKQVINTRVENETAINVSNLNAGVYIVKITEEGKTATRKLVIK